MLKPISKKQSNFSIQAIILIILIIIHTQSSQHVNIPLHITDQQVNEQRIQFYQTIQNRFIPSSQQPIGTQTYQQEIIKLQALLAFKEQEVKDLHLNLTESKEVVKKCQNRSLQLQRSYSTLQNSTKSILRENTELKINQTNYRRFISELQQQNSTVHVLLEKTITQKTYFQGKVQEAVKQINALQKAEAECCTKCPPSGSNNCKQQLLKVKELTEQIASLKTNQASTKLSLQKECQSRLSAQEKTLVEESMATMNELLNSLKDCNKELTLNQKK